MRWYLLAALVVLLVLGAVTLIGWRMGILWPKRCMMVVAPNLTVLYDGPDTIRVRGESARGITSQRSQEFNFVFRGDEQLARNFGPVGQDIRGYKHRPLHIRFEILYAADPSQIVSHAPDSVAEFVYHGDAQRILLRARDGKLVIETLPP